VFLGRVERIKGPHHAVEVARRSGRRLVIAGNLPETGPDAQFARSLVASLDGERARYVGPVDDSQKNALLGRAAALLMPIEWEEPFGIVMAEALACGTPVLGLARGSVPEVVEHGRTGFVSHDVDEMVGHVGRIDELDRAACRESARRRFSSSVMAEGFLDVYRAALRAQHLPSVEAAAP
jgi:glycosyltransferase involved in cell wall biosynthesis